MSDPTATAAKRRLTMPTETGHGTTTAYRNGCRCDDCRRAITAYARGYRSQVGPRQPTTVRPLTPDEAWEALGLDKTPFEDSPLDYADADQKSKSVFLNDERWAVMIVRKGRD